MLFARIRQNGFLITQFQLHFVPEPMLGFKMLWDTDIKYMCFLLRPHIKMGSFSGMSFFNFQYLNGAYQVE
jgi:hypothetical protein